MEIEFRGKKVPVTRTEEIPIEVAMNTDLVKNWLDSLDDTMELKSIEVQSVDAFGSGRIGFVKLKAVIMRNGVKIPGIVMLRGGAVSLLLVIRNTDNDELWSILVEQPRVPTGKQILEIPAGMLDGSGNMKGVAVKELEEECGITILPSELIDLTDLAFNGSVPGLYPSAGLCDEFLRLFAWQTTMSQQQLDELNGKLTGESPSEQITLRLCKYSDLWNTAVDMKTLSSLYLYERLIKEGKIKQI